MNKKDIRKIRVGQWVRTAWDDVGCRDMVIVEKYVDGNRISFKGYEPFSDTTQSFEADQIINEGKYLDCTNTGL